MPKTRLSLRKSTRANRIVAVAPMRRDFAVDGRIARGGEYYHCGNIPKRVLELPEFQWILRTRDAGKFRCCRIVACSVYNRLMSEGARGTTQLENIGGIEKRLWTRAD